MEEVDVKTRRISYRCLGGIYNRNGNRRVYWVDGECGAKNQEVKFYDSIFSSPRQNEKRPRGGNGEHEMDTDAPSSSKKPKLGSPFVPTKRLGDIDKMDYND